MSDEAQEAVKDFTQVTLEATGLFFGLMQSRHEMGEAKYGPIKFMDVNTLEEAMEEAVDLANYAMYTFMKLYILNQQLQKLLPPNTPDLLGPQSFMKG